jgi:S-adenosylmethionine:tRNA ribosyltransferase-isomerase
MILKAKNESRRVIAIGTTVLRCLESVATDFSALEPYEGETSLYIYPGYQFKIVDALLTNFHLPKSSLFLLVSAFGGSERIMSAYLHAIKNEYKFFSYGDSMFISKAE